jgi:hypothetical protein
MKLSSLNFGKNAVSSFEKNFRKKDGPYDDTIILSYKENLKEDFILNSLEFFFFIVKIA